MKKNNDKKLFGFVDFKRHINVRGLFKAKAIYGEEQRRYYLIHS